MKEHKPYPVLDEENDRCQSVQEPTAGAACAYEETVVPDDVAYANIVDGMLQVTSDIEEEIAEAERGEIVTMAEFKTMFSKLL